MEESLVCMTADELYITHAEFQECFIKIWAHFYSKKRVDMEKRIQNYKDYSKEFTHLDLYGNTLYIYICKKYSEIKVYRCHVVYTDLETKTHTVILIDYGEKIVVSYFDVREVTKDNLDQSFINCLSRRAALQTFLLSGYISKSKSNNKLNNILCNKHYKYQSNFVVGGITFVTLYGNEKKIIDSGLAETIDLATTNAIATSLSSTIALNFKNDIFKNCSITRNTSNCFSLKPQYLDYVNIVDVVITRVSIQNNTVLLTIQTLDNEFENLNNLLNSINRQNLKLTNVLDVYTPCLILLRKQLVRAMILEVHINSLYIDLVDYGYRYSVPRTAVFEMPPNCSFIEMRALSVILDKPNDIIVDKNMLDQKCFQMLPLKMDNSFGLYKVKLFKKVNGDLVDIYSLLKDGIGTITDKQCSIHRKSPDLFSITEINEEMMGIEDTSVSDKYVTSLNGLNSNQIEKESLELKEIESTNHSNQIEKQIEKESLELKEIESTNHITITPIMFLRKENLREDDDEIVCSLICYKSPFNFCVRQHNAQFENLMNQIKSNLDSRHVLKKDELIKNMYVIYQNQSYFIYRAQVIDMDFEVEKIKLQLVDEGDEIINENFNNVTLFNFIDSDCNILAQLVLDCSLNNMWFPVLNIDTILMLQPYFNKELLYKIQIVKTDESGIKLVQMIQNDTNVDISDAILKSGIGQRLSAAVKTDETPYEENLLKGQNFLSYVYYYHFKLSIQPEPNTVDELEEEILEYITNNPNTEPMDFNNIQGTYCLATVNDVQWYRAFIKNINEESIIVNMFDIGLLTDVSLKQIRPITSILMRKPQLCLKCNFDTKNLNIKITEKTLYNITVECINDKGELFVTIKEHNSAPLSNPIVRGIEEISYVHIDGDLTYLQRSQDKLKIEKMSETLSKLNGTLECKLSVVSGDVNLFESHGKYYRCVVKSISSKMAVVHCIDFGFEKQVEKKKLQYLGDSKIALLPALVTTVKTFPMAFNMSKTMFLANMPNDKNGTLSAMPNKMSLIHSQNELTESLESGCLVKVTCVYSNNDCWIVPHLFLERLKAISNTLLKMQSKIIPAVNEIGSLVAALHSKTKIWHRALVLNDENEETDHVLSIDSGERFKALKISKLIGEIQKIPNCAIHCQVVSKMDVKTLLNKSVMCKLLSSSQPLLEVELFSDNMVKTDSTSTRSIMEWTVRVYRFKSFNDFFVEKINDKHCLNSSNSNSQLNNFTPQPLVDSCAAKISVLSNDMSSEKVYYHCCLKDDIVDENLNDPKNVHVISNIMLSEWTLKTSSDREPYIVTLSRDGINCINFLYSILFSDNIDDHNVPKPIEFSVEQPNSVKIIELDDKYLDSVTEYPKNNIVNKKTTLQTLNESPKNAIANETSMENDVVVLDVETVTIKSIDTFQYFYAYSESLSLLYTERINSELDLCIVALPIDNTVLGFIVVTYSQKFSCWCRAKIEKILSGCVSAYCYLLDFGYYEECKEFYKPTNFLRMCPPIVRRCSLYAPQFVGKENEIWFPNIDDMFRDILTIDNIKFDMTIRKNGDPCEVSLRLEATGNSDVTEMLCPIYAQVACIRSLSDFTIRALSAGQKAVVDQLENMNNGTLTELVESPIVGNIYLGEINSQPKRVKFESFGGSKYVVTDIDDTLNALSLDKLYEVPENIRNIPIFTMTCSMINNKNEYMYSLNTFKKYVNSNVTFIMCIITESDGKTPNYVKLYFDNKDVLDIIKLRV